MDPKRGSRRIGFKTGGAAKARARVGTTRNGLFSKLFKRKPIAESTESKPAASKPAVSKPAATESTPAKTRGGRSEQMMANSAGNKGSSNKSTNGGTNRAVTGKPNTSGVTSTSKATSAVKAWKARKPTTKTMFNNQMGALGSEIRKNNQAKLDKALAAWRKEDPRKNK